MTSSCLSAKAGVQGRLIDHLRNTQSIGLEDLQLLVLDEADRLLEMGFSEEVRLPSFSHLFEVWPTFPVDSLSRVHIFILQVNVKGLFVYTAYFRCPAAQHDLSLLGRLHLQSNYVSLSWAVLVTHSIRGSIRHS